MRQKKKPFTLIDIPPDILDELRQSTPPTEAELSRYDYMRDDFIQMLHGAAPIEKKTTVVDLVLSWSGKVMETAREVRAELLPGGLQPAWSCRAIGAKSTGKPAGTMTAAEKKSGGFRLVLVYCSAPERYLELDVFDDIEKVEIRPFTVYVSDETGKSLSEPVTVGPTQGAPRFPDPAAGHYVFEVMWSGGRDAISISIGQEG